MFGPCRHICILAFRSLGRISLRQHRLIQQLNSPCSIQMHGCPGKMGSILCFSMVIKKCNNSLVCCGGFHSRSTLSGSRSPGRTPPSVGALTPCPKAKARTGSNTRHGLPHSTCTPLQCRQAGSAPQSGHSLFVIFSPRASPSSIQIHGRKNRQHFVLLKAYQQVAH